MKNYRWTALARMLSMIAVPAVAAELATVYRSPSCGCCEGWVAYLKSNGFDATVVSTEDLAAVKEKMHALPVAQAMTACPPTCAVRGRNLQRQLYVDASRLLRAHSLMTRRMGKSTQSEMQSVLRFGARPNADRRNRLLNWIRAFASWRGMTFKPPKV